MKARRSWGRKEPETSVTKLRMEDLTPVPGVAANERVTDTRLLNPPFAFSRIVYDEGRSTYRYEVHEPPLGPDEKEALASITAALVRTLDVDYDELDAIGARRYLAEKRRALAERHGRRLSETTEAKLQYYLERDLMGYGPIDVMMRDPAIEDISCDGPGIPLFVYDRKHESIRTNVVVPDEAALDSYVMRLVQRSGRHISIAEPLIDATLPDGSRLQASLSDEVTTRGSTFTVRRFRDDPFTPIDLLNFDSASPQLLAYLWLAMESGSSGLICGGTASGKTTTLNAMSVFIPFQKKIVSIEDTRELNLPHENWIPGVTRAGSLIEERAGKRVGEVDMFDLLKAALRQRPEYLILGEVRGAEAYVLFQAMATGHAAYSTVHADSVDSVVHRLESKPIEIPRNLLASLDFVCVQGETRVSNRRVRKIRDVVEISGVDARSGELLTNRVFEWQPRDNTFRYTGASRVLAHVARERNVADATIDQEVERRARLLQGMKERGIRDIKAVSRLVAAYAVDPERALAEVHS